MTTQDLLANADAAFTKAFAHLKTELAGLQIGRASAALVENLTVEAYGSHQPLKNIASVSVPDAKTLAIQPWDRSTLGAIEKAIRDSNLGLNPNNDGTRVILNIPPLTEERRKQLTKVVGTLSEEARITIRRERQDTLNHAKRLAKAEEITEDEEKVLEKKVQEKVDAVNRQIDEVSKTKEAEILKI